MDITTTSPALLRLLQLSSVSLPVGGFSFSQGMEQAIESGWIVNKKQTKDWLSAQLFESVARIDLPVLAGLMKTDYQPGFSVWQHWNDISLANRETAELRLTESAMGEALKRLLKTLDVEVPNALDNEYSFVALFAVAANSWSIEFPLAAHGFVWSWLENQVSAATKLVPLGQTQAQQLLIEMHSDIQPAIELALSLDESTLGGSLPALAIASSKHETQYSRLFRS